MAETVSRVRMPRARELRRDSGRAADVRQADDERDRGGDEARRARATARRSERRVVVEVDHDEPSAARRARRRRPRACGLDAERGERGVGAEARPVGAVPGGVGGPAAPGVDERVRRCEASTHGRVASARAATSSPTVPPVGASAATSAIATPRMTVLAPDGSGTPSTARRPRDGARRPASVAATTRRSTNSPRTASTPPVGTSTVIGPMGRSGRPNTAASAFTAAAGPRPSSSCSRWARSPSPSMSTLGRVRSEPLRQPPGLLAEQRHERGHERHAHEERVEGDADREAEARWLDRTASLGHEGDEDEEHDERGGGDHAGRVLEAVHDRRRAGRRRATYSSRMPETRNTS